MKISKPVLILKIGKGGSGTFITDDNQFVDAQKGEDTIISELKIVAEGGFASNRMTQLGVGVSPDRNGDYIPEKYFDLYKISPDDMYGAGGEYSPFAKTDKKANNGHAGLVIIQW